VTTRRLDSVAPVSPAASANGTVRPSAIPITTSRTTSPAVKWRSTCGVCGMAGAGGGSMPEHRRGATGAGGARRAGAGRGGPGGRRLSEPRRRGTIESMPVALEPDEIADLRRFRDWRSWSSIAVNWGLVAAAMALVARWPNPLTVVLAIFVIGG